VLLHLTTKIRDFRPSIWGKANTVVQIVAVTCTLWVQFYSPSFLVLLKQWALVATFVLTLVSWFHYTWREVRRTSVHEDTSAL